MSKLIEHVIADCRLAAQAFAPSSSSSRVKWVEQQIDKYEKRLRRINKAPAAKRPLLANKLILNSAAARMLSLMRSYAKRDMFPSGMRLQKEAYALNLQKPTYEKIILRVVFSKGKIKPRFIVEPGRMRTAKSIVLRDYILALGLSSENDFALKGKGGVDGLIQNVKADMVAGYTHWSCPDVTDCYLSLRMEHFQGLPINDSLIKNVAFLSKGKIVVVCNPKDQAALTKYLADVPPSYAAKGMSLTSLVTKMVRQSLPLGLPTSPLLASCFIQQVVTASIASDVKSYAYADNMVIGALSKSEAMIAIDAVSKAFAQHPAGPIGLHDMKVTGSKNTTALGYEFIPGKGYGANKVHVKPSQQSFERFKAKLSAKLTKADGGDVIALFIVAENYAASWYASKSAWTKVPSLSWEACLNSTYTYVSDWKVGIPMGTQKLNAL